MTWCYAVGEKIRLLGNVEVFLASWRGAVGGGFAVLAIGAVLATVTVVAVHILHLPVTVTE